MSAAPVQVGDVIAGKFRIESVLGRGGMGVVLKATHLTLDEPVALKFMTVDREHDAERVARFVREAKAAIRLKGKHVTRVLDVAKLDNGVPYIVMECLEGEDLAGFVKRRGPLPVQEAVDFILQACVAMAEAHRAGIIHRDLKPQNLFVTTGAGNRPLIKVLDFGISKLMDDDVSVETGTHDAMGSPLFMSPEQMRSARSVDSRTDIWALGAILHFALAGEPPFRRGSLPDLIMRVMKESPQPLPDSVDAPDELQALVSRCLEKSADARFADVGELADRLAPLASERGSKLVAEVHDHLSRSDATTRSREPVRLSSVSGYEETRHGAGGTVTDPPKQPAPTKKRSFAPLIAAAVIVAVAVGGYLVARDGGESKPVTAPSDAVARATDARAQPTPKATPDAARRAQTPDAGTPDARAKRPPRRVRRRPPRVRRRDAGVKRARPVDARVSPRDRRN